MSSQKGNIKRTRPQKYQNTRVFKNDIYDKTPKTKLLNTLEITDVCIHCKGVLEWRIKFKKYKISKAARTCVKCNQKNVLLSYRTICASCAAALKVCPKCGKHESELLPGSFNPQNVKECELKSDEDEEDEGDSDAG